MIFSPAIPAHPEGCHRRVGTVVGYLPDDAEAGTAMRAIGKGITEVPVRRIFNIAETVAARGRIGRDQDLFFSARVAFQDPEGLVMGDGHLFNGDVTDTRKHGRMLSHGFYEGLHIRFVSFGVHDNAPAGIKDCAFYPLFPCKVIDKGTEPHSLDNAFYRDKITDQSFRCGFLIAVF